MGPVSRIEEFATAGGVLSLLLFGTPRLQALVSTVAGFPRTSIEKLDRKRVEPQITLSLPPKTARLSKAERLL